jgi:hypothetical protein
VTFIYRVISNTQAAVLCISEYLIDLVSIINMPFLYFHGKLPALPSMVILVSLCGSGTDKLIELYELRLKEKEELISFLKKEIERLTDK